MNGVYPRRSQIRIDFQRLIGHQGVDLTHLACEVKLLASQASLRIEQSRRGSQKGRGSTRTSLQYRDGHICTSGRAFLVYKYGLIIWNFPCDLAHAQYRTICGSERTVPLNASISGPEGSPSCCALGDGPGTMAHSSTMSGFDDTPTTALMMQMVALVSSALPNSMVASSDCSGPMPWICKGDKERRQHHPNNKPSSKARASSSPMDVYINSPGYS